MRKIYKDFSDVEKEITNKAPKMYKYRSWDDELHRKILIDNVIWFAHPKSLNDPYDIRVPLKFDISEIDHPRFFEVLKEAVIIGLPQIKYPSKEFDEKCNQILNQIRQNPEEWANNRFRQIREGNLYDRIGLFSLTRLPTNEVMWAHYGNNGKGICIGFNNVELIKELKVGAGFVTYTDEISVQSFITPPNPNEKGILFYKQSKWNYEEEFRLVTPVISKERDRLKKIRKEIIEDVILGIDASLETEKAIVKILKNKYGSKVKLFKSQVNVSSFGLELKEIKY